MKSDPKKPGPQSIKSSKTAAPSAQKSSARAAATAVAPERPRKAEPALARKSSAPAIPSILLEGDAPSAPKAGGPGERYALGPAGSAPTSPTHALIEAQELPESYGTQRLFLTARDPHWVYAHWDLTQEQLKRYNGRSVDKHLVLRIYKNEAGGEPHRQIHVHPESKNWFCNVGEGGSRYVAELGYYRPSDTWVSISTSGATLTPPDSLSDDISVWFATLPVDMQFDQLLRLVRIALQDNIPLLEAIKQLRATGFPMLPDAQAAATGRWNPEQERAMSQVITMDSVRRVWMGSLEITELIRRQFLQEMSSQTAAQFGIESSWSGGLAGSVTSPFGAGAERKKGFWFNVNAELIIYGSTEADATVTIGGRQIKLRPDGSFAYRFALPDGQYDLPAVAISNDGTDSRAAELKFNRTTHYRGDVGKHPQDAALKPPLAAHVS